MPESLEGDRETYLRDIEAARDSVDAWFAANGFPVDRRELVDRAVVFADVAEAKRGVAKHFGIPEDQVPDGFSGTVDGKTLFVVSRETYAATYMRLYPDHPWSSDAYRALIAHELAHRAHASEATVLFGSEDGMGPRWFFEGLAITCAAQFAEEPGPALEWDQLEDLIVKDSTTTLGYPLYGRMFRSVAAKFTVRWLVERAGKSGFAELLENEYRPSASRLEAPTGGQRP